MRWTRPVWTSLAAISGFIAVAAGAFAAHGMQRPDGEGAAAHRRDSTS